FLMLCAGAGFFFVVRPELERREKEAKTQAALEVLRRGQFERVEILDERKDRTVTWTRPRDEAFLRELEEALRNCGYDPTRGVCRCLGYWSVTVSVGSRHISFWFADLGSLCHMHGLPGKGYIKGPARDRLMALLDRDH
ncbi:MAG: hypothetical protein HYY16_13930, partial [Planctomycetes bacterium]|nr:hypothetical protein [Planctomycetota bacterium]